MSRPEIQKGRDCNQYNVWATFSAPIDTARTGFLATETAIIHEGLHSISPCLPYLPLNGITLQEHALRAAECEVIRAEKVSATRLVGVLRARQTVCSTGYAPSIQATSSFQRLSFSLYTGGSEVPLPMAWGGVQATPA